MSRTPPRNRLALAAFALAGGLAFALPAEAVPFAPAPLAGASTGVVQAQYGYDYGRRHHGYEHGPRHFDYGPPRHRHFGGHHGWDGPRFRHHHHYPHHHHHHHHGHGHGGW